MTDANALDFGRLMHALGQTFNEPVSAIRSEAYFDALRDLDIAQVQQAVRQSLASCRFFPRPVELRDLVLGTAHDHADAAWGEVLREVRRVGYTGTPAFADERVQRAVRETWGSWSRLCQTLPAEGPELIGWIKQFKATYQSLSSRDTSQALLTASTLDPTVRSFIATTQRRLAANRSGESYDVATDARDH